MKTPASAPASSPSGRQPMRAALARLTGWFATRPTRAGVVARTLTGTSRSEDAVLRDALLATWEEEGREDGSVGGAVLPTIWRVHEVLDLGVGRPPMLRDLTLWIEARQGLPGGFPDGCVPVRHRHRACEHFLSGFLSPAPPEVAVTPITLPTGKTFRAEPAARFALSCLGLHALLRAGVRSLDIDRHLHSLSVLIPEWTDWNGYYAPDLAASALTGLACSTKYDGAIAKLTAIIAMNQVNGTWPHGDLFHFLNALTWTRDDAAHRILTLSVPALLARQRQDGSFGSGGSEERSLIALRVLRRVSGKESAIPERHDLD